MSLLPPIRRRDWIRSLAVGLGGLSLSRALPALAETVAASPQRRRSCILLWMSGGPAQTDTFDMKPGHENGGEFKEIATTVPGLRICEHLPRLAKHADDLAIVRSLRTTEGDHARGSYLMRTGQRPMGPVKYPSIACSLAKELAPAELALPQCVSIAPFTALSQEAFGSGFLGPKHAPLVVAPRRATSAGMTELGIDSLQPAAGVSEHRLARRREIWRQLQGDFVSRRAGGAAFAQNTVYQQSMELMNPRTSEAFDLSQEPAELRESYGPGVFGQGCLMARRLVERGVPVVEVALSQSAAGGLGWDTHSDNFRQLTPLLAELDAGWGALMTDLKQRGLLESTTILWMGEFGRTPKINSAAGRDHYPAAWSCAFAGGGIAGGQAYGRTSPDGTQVEEDPVAAADVLTTLIEAVGADPDAQNTSTLGRPIKLAEGSAIRSILS